MGYTGPSIIYCLSGGNHAGAGHQGRHGFNLKRKARVMAHTYEELKTKTVAELREIASGIEHDAVKGYTQLNKEHLLAALCQALKIDMHEHRKVVGINKGEVKLQIKGLKKKREEALAAHDHVQLKTLRRQIHDLKRKMHRFAILER